MSFHIQPKNKAQDFYLRALRTNDQVIATGPAGTGKTFLACSYAASLIESKHIRDVILVRPNIPGGKSLGFIPGTLEEKMEPWAAPLIDVFKERLGKHVEYLQRKGRLKIVPFETMRGASWDNAFIILDEAQNTTIHEMMMFLTRIGENSRVVISGDVNQSDTRLKENGLSKIVSMVHKQKLPVEHINFLYDDIVRSDACAMWIKAFGQEGE